MKSILITFFLYSAFILNLNAQDYLGSINQKDENGYTAGTISGSLSVSPGGAASYVVPIELPEGRMGMTPQLALSYSSQGEYGLLGKGWSLSGWSYIARAGENLYYDDKQSSVNFAGDGFTIDGARMIRTSESDKGSVIYRTETDIFAKIVHLNTQEKDTKDVSYFMVYTKDGLTKTYGSSNNSKQVYGSHDKPAIRYHLNKVEDSKGNFIEYNYQREIEKGEVRLKQILYTGNEKVAGDAGKEYYSINFLYNADQLELGNMVTSYFNKESDLYAYKVTGLLKEIEIRYGATQIKKYQIQYSKEGDLEYPYLTGIELFAGNEKMNPLKFTWNHPVNNTLDNFFYRKDNFSPNYSYNQKNKYLKDDLDFDGKDDIIEVGNFGQINDWDDKGTYIRLGKTLSIRKKLDDYTGQYNKEKEVYLIDFNGDGEKELFIDGKVYNFDFSLPSYLIQRLDKPTTGEFLIKHIGDFNGDGIQDVIVKQDAIYNVYFGNSNIAQGYSNKYEIENYGIVSDAIACLPGDFIGKGTTNFCIVGSDYSFSVYELEKSDSRYAFSLHSVNASLLTQIYRLAGITPGDFNGDGKTDVLVSYREFSTNDKTKILYSYGKGFDSHDITPYTPLIDDFDQSGYHEVTDINNDGISDIVFCISENNYYGSNGVYKLIVRKYIKKPNVSGGFVMTEVSEDSKYISPQGGDEFFDDGFILGDFTGTGNFDCFRSFCFFNLDFLPRDAGRVSEIFSSNSTIQPIDAITQITDGFGKTDKIVYKKYIPGITDTKFPITNFNQAFYVVDQIEADLSKTVPVQKYTYKNMLAHAQGKGLLGFEYTAVDDLINNTLSEVRNVVYNSSEQGDQYRPVVFLYPESSVVTYLDENLVTKKISESSSEITIKRTCENDLFNHFENLIHIPVVTLSVSQNWDIDDNNTYIGCNVQVQSINDIDLYGNNKKIVSYADESKMSNFPGLESDYSWVEIVETSYVTPDDNDLANWIISRPEKIKATSKHHPRSGDCKQPESHFSVTNFIYYPKEHEHYPLLQFKKESPLGNADLETSAEFDYDDFGNVIKKTITTPEDPEEPNINRVKITEYTYNPDANYRGRFLTEEKVIAGSAGNDMITRYDYYINTGALKTLTDINGLTTTFGYDAFGKKDLTTLPDGTSMISIVGWSKGMEDAPENALFCIAKGKQLANSSIIWNKEVVFFDKLQRALRSVSLNLSSKFVYSSKEYDEFGRLSRVSEPYFKTSEASLYTSYKYDRAGRNFATITPTGAIITTESKGRVTTVTNDATGNWSEKEVNIKGMPIRINDKTNGNIEFCYDAAGRETAVKKYGLLTTFTYDDFGNREEINDPDAGVTFTEYNKQNQIDNSTDARKNRLEFKHDHLGRLWKRKNITDNDEVEYIYYDKSNEDGFGKLKYIIKKDLSTGVEIHKTEFIYDNLERISTRKEYIDSEIYTFVYNYNSSSGELEYYQYPTGYRIKYRYNNDGYMNMVEDVSTGLMLWNALDNNARGQLTDFSLGNGLYTQNQFDQYGFPRRITTTDFNKKQFIKPYSESPETAPDAIPETIQDNTHYFNIHNGNLMQKWDLYDENKWFCEKYEYDPVLNERLTKWYKYPGGVEYSINYSNSGNINNKTGITVPGGSYNYGSNAGPHAVTGITGATQDYIGANAHYMQNVSYNGINMPYYMHQMPQSGGFKMDRIRITYGNGDQRVKTEFSTVYEHYVETDTRYYFGDFEVEKKHNSSDKVYYHYLAGTNGVFAIMKWKGVEDLSIYYIHPDYLGSLQVISDEYGNKIEQMSFDPWGRRRNPADGTFTNLPTTFLFTRGFTGHEHYDKFGLINMNARLYDPFLGRFLSPDPQVQAPGYGQNYNRYTYALNNPLKYTDPDGEFVHLILGAIIGGYINLAMNAHKVDNFWQALGYFGIGAAAGALSAGVSIGVSAAIAGAGATGVAGASFATGFLGTSSAISTGFLSGFVSGSAAGLTSGFVSGFGNGALTTGNLAGAFRTGIDYAWKGAISGGIIGGTLGGIDARKNDLNFWTGSKKQNILFALKENGKVVYTSEADIDRISNGYSSVNKLPDHYKTFVTQENPFIDFSEVDQLSFNIPKRIDFVASKVFAPRGNVFFLETRIEKNIFTMTFFPGEDFPKFYLLFGTRYPTVDHFGDLFHSRLIKWPW